MSMQTLEELCELIVDCKNRTPPAAPVGEGVAFSIGTPDIVDGRIRLQGAKRVTQETYDIWTARAVPRADDIILTREAPVGRVGRIEDGMILCLGQRTMLLRPDISRTDPRFLHYFLLSDDVQAMLHGHASGSTVPHLRVAQVRTLPVPLVPDLAVQRAIGQLLGALDEKIAVDAAVAATSRELSLAFFGQAVHSDQPVEVMVESVVTALTRGVAPKYTDSSDELPVLNQKCVRDGRVNLELSRLTLREKVNASKLLQRNDVLVNSTGVGTLGRVARWTLPLEATVDSHITIVRFDKQKVDPVCAGFAMLLAQPDIEAMGEGSTGQTELRRAQVGGLEITLPSSAAQKELRIRLDALEERAEQALAESRTLAALRNALIPQLMSGRLRVRDAERIVEDAV
ncbi:restriction endonuclease subunit S [Streptomyces sp. NPDC097981]|uniref:restriction endonuclease subunit S n=1 Tax=Streptomyces sp. NPDC097981 TaxID=3155428 RepID=UPI00333449E8